MAFIHSSIDGYSFGKELGRGNYGKVVEAVRETDGQEVAIKCISNTKQKLREVTLMRTLEHQHIVTLLDYVQIRPSADQTQHFLVMELASGTLQTLLEQGVERDWWQVKLWLQQCLQALCYMHSQGIMHRDIKPENILVSRSGSVRIADLGSAKVLSGKMGMSGTRSYMAPDVRFGSEAYRFSADMWGMGLVFFWAITGTNPLLKEEYLKDAKPMLALFFGKLSPEDFPGHDLPDLVTPVFSARPNCIVLNFLKVKLQQTCGDAEMNGHLDAVGRLVTLDDSLTDGEHGSWQGHLDWEGHRADQEPLIHFAVIDMSLFCFPDIVRRYYIFFFFFDTCHRALTLIDS